MMKISSRICISLFLAFVAGSGFAQAPVVTMTGSTNCTCGSSCTGTAAATVTGGVAPLTYSWSPAPGNGQGTLSASSMCGASYTLTVTDAASNSVQGFVTITQPAILVNTPAQTNVACAGGATGTAIATVTGGTGAITYSWTPSGGTASTASALAAGTYTCTVKDANACTLAHVYTINPPPSIAASQVNDLCFGGSTGSATATVLGGTTAYTYSWTPSGGTAATASSLAAGTFTCTIHDSKNCTATHTFTITQPTSSIYDYTGGQTNVLCYGAATGMASVGNPSGGTAPYTYSWSPSGGNTAIASGLTANNYTCTIKDANGCAFPLTLNITEPAAIVTTPTQTNVSCNGGATGSAKVTVTGGVTAYTYSWAPSGGTAATASALSAQNYTCTVKDANGCVKTQSFTVTQPAALAIASGKTNVTCNGAANGIATATVSGGTTTYTYVWSPSGGSAATATALAPASYTCSVTDAHGCTANSIFTITQPTVLSATTSQTNLACNGVSTGTATITVSGGTPGSGYNYSWLPSGGSAATASGLAAGTFTCTASDSNNCVITKTYTLTQPAAITTSTSSVASACTPANGTATGSTATGGVSPYTYSWTPAGSIGGGQGTLSATGLAASTYTLSITDHSGCVKSFTTVVSNTSLPTSAIVSQTNENCFGQATAAISVHVTNGTAPFTYSWTPSGSIGSGQGTATASALPIGSYTLLATDSKGCTTSQSVSITSPTQVTGTTVVTNVSCNGSANGSVVVSAHGGGGTYTYSWSPAPTGGQGTTTATGLAPGTFTCFLTDNFGCTGSSTSTITQPATLTSTAAQTNVKCNGASTGSATVTVTGGTTPYTYAWSPSGGTAATASSLAAGIYGCTITDANGCTASSSVTLTQPTALVVTPSSTQTGCGTSTGTATVTPSGGAGGYAYSWNPTPGNGQATATASSMAAGTYTSYVVDANVCQLLTIVNITSSGAPTSSVVSTTNLTCNGVCTGASTIAAAGGNPPYTYSWAPSGGTAATASALCAGNYSCTIHDASNCTAIQTVVISQPTALLVNPSQVNNACAGQSIGSAQTVPTGGTGAYTYSWNPSGNTTSGISNLAPGSYTLTLKDANGCSPTPSTQLYVISSPLALANTPNHFNAACFGGSSGSATASGSGGTSPYTYSWSPTSSANATLAGLAIGAYTCTLTDAHACSLAATYTITQPAALASAPAHTNETCAGGQTGTVTANVSGGTGPYTYSWSPLGGTGASASVLPATHYLCNVTDAKGCTLAVHDTIFAPPAIVMSFIQTNVSCSGSSTGSATVTVTGGTGAYTYSWTPSGGTASVASNLSAGTYTCSVKDANGCSQSTAITITQPNALVQLIPEPQQNLLCNGASNGWATALVVGGTPLYTYSWAPTGGTDSVATGLPAGAYTCNIKDANGCTLAVNYTLTAPTALVNTPSQTNILCNGSSTGSATASVSGGTPGTGGYFYYWAPVGGSTSIAQALSAGTYTCTITDTLGCTLLQTYTITTPATLSFTVSLNNVLCSGGSDGSATANVTGGSGNYTYSWSPNGSIGAGQGTASVTGLTAGTYTCLVQDANACSSSQTLSVSEPAALAVTPTQTNLVCTGAATGSASATVSGGTVAYTYNWTPSGGTAATASALTAGTYTCSIQDANACSLAQTYTITAPTALVITPGQSNDKCFGNSAGSANASVSGGTGTYTYAWAPSGGTAPTAVNLAAGTYTCAVTDASACSLAQTYTITSPAALVITPTSTNLSCNASGNGSVSVNVTGGTGTYTYNWNSTASITTGQGTASVSGLAFGTYTCLVTDANACTNTQTVTLTQPNALAVTPSQTNLLCTGAATGAATATVTGGTTGYTYSWAPTGGTLATANGLTSGSFTCTITDAHACVISQIFTLTQPASVLFTSLTDTNATCTGCNGSVAAHGTGGTGAYTYSWSPGGLSAASLTGLCAGSYTCQINDANGCTSLANATLTQASSPVITGTVTAPLSGAINSGWAYLVRFNGLHQRQPVIDSVAISNGRYTFTGQLSGNYLVYAIASKSTYPNVDKSYSKHTTDWDSATVIAAPCASADTANITMFELLPTTGGGSFSGIVLQDSGFVARLAFNTNPGILLDGDPVPGLDVNLEQHPGSIMVSQTTTGADGSYHFTNVAPGSYQIVVDIPGLTMVSTYVRTITGNQSYMNLDYQVDSVHIHPDSVLVTAVPVSKPAASTNLVLSPNPFKDELNISYSVYETSDVVIEIFDILGERVLSVVRPSQDPGAHTYQLDTASCQLPEGVYTLRMTVGTQTISRRIVCMK